MAFDKYNYTKGTEYSAYAPCRRAAVITPSANELGTPSRAITVSDDDATITGIPVGQDTSITTHPLKIGVVYPFSFKVISAVSAGTVIAWS